MKKIIKKWGGSLVIVFNKDDIKILNIKEGEVIDLEIIKNRKQLRRNN